jgi:hydroxymethylpyrimidine pyrophosphatase-like HAD family hydrolase
VSGDSTSHLEEYRTLRGEILAKQGQRVQVLAFNVAAFGAIIVATAQKAITSLSNPTEGALIVFCGSVGHFAVLVPSIYFTIRHSQQISNIGTYIIDFIESKDEGLNWHTHWRETRAPRARTALALIYAGLATVNLALSLLALYHIGLLTPNYYVLTVISGLVSLLLASDLWLEWLPSRFRSMAEMASFSELLLASDVDNTLLASHEFLGGELLALICKLLESGRIRLAIITGNDYENLQRQRVVEPIPEALRKNLVVYSDGCTRKLTFTDKGEEVESQDYHRQIAFERGDKEIIKDLLASQLKEWARSYPDLHIPDIEVQLFNDTIQLAIGPLNVNQPELEARRDEFQERVIRELKQKCDEVQLAPSDKLWLRVHCKVREGDSLSGLKGGIETSVRELLSADFPDLSRPTIIDRGQQLALKPVKADLRETLIGHIKDKVCGDGRLKGQYGALVGGRTTIDIQKYGVDKALAMRDLQDSLDYQGEILYFGDSFGEQGNDRPVAYVEGVQCISVGGGENLPPGVIAMHGGPAATTACLRSILWTLTGCSK